MSLTSNQLKFIACLSMVVDHIGYFLFPDAIYLRIIGRLAMPIFAFFIGEGCRKTHSRPLYFLRVFALALLCQGGSVAYEILTTGRLSALNLNILFTFSISMLLCFCYLSLRKKSGAPVLPMICFALLLAGSIFLCDYAPDVFGFPIGIDYGMAGILLPLFAVASDNREQQITFYTLGMVVFNILLMDKMPYIWVSMLALVLLLFYQGKPGERKYRWGFYIFYPLHIALLCGIRYLVDILK